MAEEAKWYVAHTYSGYENTVKATIEKAVENRNMGDLILAVNRRYGRADYLPCIAWGAIAQQTARLPVGSRLTVEGRVQSRGYTKTVDGVGQERTAYEVSIMRPAEPEEFLL